MSTANFNAYCEIEVKADANLVLTGSMVSKRHLSEDEVINIG
jgi:hypothetical protein